eukprot:gene3440-6089_t
MEKRIKSYDRDRPIYNETEYKKYFETSDSFENPLIVKETFGEKPQRIACPHCGQEGLSVIIRENGTFTYKSVLYCSLVCCCLFPLILPNFKDVVHHCSNPKCLRVVGRKIK